MVKDTGAFPRVHVDTAAVSAVGYAGGVLLTETIRATGLDRALSGALGQWRKPLATHDPAKVILDLAVTLALGGDALSDIATVRAEPGVYGVVASDPAVSRTITALAADTDRVLAAIDSARQTARQAAWALAGDHASDAAASADAPLVIDLDATLLSAHSEKEQAGPTFKRGPDVQTRVRLPPADRVRRPGPGRCSRSDSARVMRARIPRPTTSMWLFMNEGVGGV